MRCSGYRLEPGLECVFTRCLAQLRGMCEGVWRQSGRVCDLKPLNGGGSKPLPFHPHSPFPDKREPLTGSDGAKLVKIALPAPLSSLGVGLSLLLVRLWVFGGGGCTRFDCFIRQPMDFYIREIQSKSVCTI